MNILTYNDAHSPLVFGTMGLGGGWNDRPITPADQQKADDALHAAYDRGIYTIDLADIYQYGKSDQAFGDWLRRNPSVRKDLVLQTKASIRLPNEQQPTRYDWSKDHLIHSVEESLKRLNTSYIDVLLLHRFDPLANPEDLREALDYLKATGMVRDFGVSNMGIFQLQYLKSITEHEFVVNQLQMSLGHLGFVDHVIDANTDRISSFPNGTLEYCMTEGIELQGWGALAQGKFTGNSPEDAPENVHRTAALIDKMCGTYQANPTAIVLAWLMTHPANIRPVIGTTNPDRIRDAAKAEYFRLSHEDWYTLYENARGVPLP